MYVYVYTYVSISVSTICTYILFTRRTQKWYYQKLLYFIFYKNLTREVNLRCDTSFQLYVEIGDFDRFWNIEWRVSDLR